MFKFILSLFIALTFAFGVSAQPKFWKNVWKNTDFSKTSIDFNSVLDGGPGKDGIPAILDPVMDVIANADGLADREPVISINIDGELGRAYPIRYLMWHEIVNDRVGNVPIAITFCPLCNSGVVFDRRLDGQTLTMGVSGMLRNSDMIMYDHQTESWWQQFTGEAIVGELLDKKLTKLPSRMESWGNFKERNPDGLVQREPQVNRPYGQNPYAGYDTGRPFLYNGENPPNGINPMARVVVVGDRAWPLQRISKAQVLNEEGLTFSWTKGTSSALDTREISKGRDIGAIRVTDKAGKDVVHDVAFAFAFHAFNPNGKWMLGN